MQINPEKLIMLRKRNRLTAEALAELAGVGRATITRIENGRTAVHTATTIGRLCKALGCKPEDLASPPEKTDPAKLLSSRQSTPHDMSAACQNALSLVAIRYGEKPETILELAPLMFDLIARESLIERRDTLAALRAHRDAIGAMASKFPHFSGRFTNDWEADDFEHREELSIDRDDLRGELVHADNSMNDSFYPDGFDEECDNPFVAHLKGRCERLGQRGYEVPRLDAISRWLGPTYELCLAEAAELAGGDDELAHALVSGVVPVASIPKELLKAERLSDRQEWMRQQRSESADRTNALLAELGLADILGE